MPSASARHPTNNPRPRDSSLSNSIIDTRTIGEDNVGETVSDGLPSHVEAGMTIGAPTEKISPLGYHVNPLAVIFLNIGKMIGTGIFTTPGSILQGVGSVGLSLIFWVIGYIFAGAFLAVYLEYASYFPYRSGAEVAYLEKAYPTPRYLIPTAFAVQSVLLSSSTSPIILARYLLTAAGAETSTWNVRGTAVGIFTCIIVFCVLSTKWSLRLSNALGIVKIGTLLFIALTGLVVLGGHTSVEDPKANFRNAFEGTTSNGNGLATALVKVNFAYVGFENAFNLMNEIKSSMKVMKKSAPMALTLVFILYFFANVAYFAAIPKADIASGKEMTASLFFRAVFGNSHAITALSVLISLSSFGSVLSSAIGTSRAIRECARQGVLPYPRFWASTKPFNTPSGPFLLKWIVTVIIILAPPAGDAFNFIVDLQSYPANIFGFLLTAGLWLVRRRRQKIDAPPSEFRAWNVVLAFCLAINVYVLILPWVPPQGGIYSGDVSFFYATYCVVGLAILGLSALVYFVWFLWLPKYQGYAIRQKVECLDDGAQTTCLVRIPNDQLVEWDSIYDEQGNSIHGKETSYMDGSKRL